MATDSLDTRLEAIRIKNEELEKKHKEILEDELRAKQSGAIVVLKSQSDEPKSHPYDKLDLDFDVKDEDKELSRNPDFKPKSESSSFRNVCNLANFFMFSSCLQSTQIEDRCHGTTF